MKNPLIWILLNIYCCLHIQAQSNLSLQIVHNGDALPFALVQSDSLEYTGQSDMDGLIKIPVTKSIKIFDIKINYLGFHAIDTLLRYAEGMESISLEMRPVSILMTEYVVSGTRTNKRRLESPVAIQVLSGKTLGKVNASNLAEGMCFQPGLRVESNCQTCNYTQLRINGLGGSYSQILIDSRPVFSSIMSLYSLEQIPSNQIERIEVVRGGGSILYGANAIAGTVNVITKEPQSNSWSIAEQVGLIGGQSFNHQLNLNGTILSKNGKQGFSVYAHDKYRAAYDHNGDGFSELPLLQQTSFGGKWFLKLAPQHRLEANIWKIDAYRRGGDQMDLPADQAEQSEERDHQILAGGINYVYQSEDKRTSGSTYFSFQRTNRKHYTGIAQSDGWGNTSSYTLVGGAQYNRIWRNKLGEQVMTIGVEHQQDYTFDAIPAYNYLIDQLVDLTGVFIQSDWSINSKWSLLFGVRQNWHTNLSSSILTPRLNLLYKANDKHQLRLSYAQGFKPAQAFEADMHIAFSGGSISRIEVDNDLIPETSDSYTATWDFNQANSQTIYGFTCAGFYTRLHHAFTLQEIGSDLLGNQVLFRSNGSDAIVRGISLDARLNLKDWFQVESGITIQDAFYGDAVSWSSELPGEKTFLRTPAQYGYFNLGIRPEQDLNATIAWVYTGPMLVPHFAGSPEQLQDELIQSPSFNDINIQLEYLMKLPASSTDLTWRLGITNLLNAYQNDFDTGPLRDSNYIYGPLSPRSYTLGLILSFAD